MVIKMKSQGSYLTQEVSGPNEKWKSKQCKAQNADTVNEVKHRKGKKKHLEQWLVISYF